MKEKPNTLSVVLADICWIDIDSLTISLQLIMAALKNITCKHKGCLCILTRLIFSPIFKQILMILKANIKHFECVHLKCTTFIRDQR